MDLVAVNFVRGGSGALSSATTSNEPVVARGKVPRAYIFFASPYDHADAERIPNEIWTPRLGVMLTAPSGEPYSVSLDRFAAEKHLSAESAGKELRLSSATIHVYPALRDDVLDPLRSRSLRHTEPRIGETPDGLGMYGFDPRGPLTFLDPNNPAVRRIGCMLNVERSRPEHYCDYEIILADNLVAKASFVDFRLHGGRQFARERMAEIRDTLCQFLPCENAFE